MTTNSYQIGEIEFTARKPQLSSIIARARALGQKEPSPNWKTDLEWILKQIDKISERDERYSEDKFRSRFDRPKTIHRLEIPANRTSAEVISALIHEQFIVLHGECEDPYVRDMMLAKRYAYFVHW